MGRSISFVLSTAKLSETIAIVRVRLSLSSHTYAIPVRMRGSLLRSYQILKNCIRRQGISSFQLPRVQCVHSSEGNYL